MPIASEVLSLDEALNDLAKLYQFRSLDDRLYGALTVSQSYCLRILYFQGATTMSALAGELDVRLSTMTGVIDQLEEQGLVTRVDHPGDRRSLLVELTAKGHALYKQAHDAFLSHLEPLFDGLRSSARKDVLDFLGKTIQVIQGWRENPRKVRRHDDNQHSKRATVGRGSRAGHLRAVRRR